MPFMKIGPQWSTPIAINGRPSNKRSAGNSGVAGSGYGLPWIFLHVTRELINFFTKLLPLTIQYSPLSSVNVHLSVRSMFVLYHDASSSYGIPK